MGISLPFFVIPFIALGRVELGNRCSCSEVITAFYKNSRDKKI